MELAVDLNIKCSEPRLEPLITDFGLMGKVAGLEVKKGQWPSLNPHSQLEGRKSHLEGRSLDPFFLQQRITTEKINRVWVGSFCLLEPALWGHLSAVALQSRSA